MLSLDKRNIPESGIHNCLCGATYAPKDPNGRVRIIEPTVIGGKDHPARGMVVGQGYGMCKDCGLQSQRAKTTAEVIANWNSLMSMKVNF